MMPNFDKQLRDLLPADFGYRSTVTSGFFIFAPKGAVYLQWNVSDNAPFIAALKSLGVELGKSDMGGDQFAGADLKDPKFNRLNVRFDKSMSILSVWLARA
jgi:hypothetical protein